ncbi:hypothetical protein B0A55_01704 [Friedmanniomyces simplex]|uniref:Uncharacterized protein n=1 Tax=Friedmanniomyces simplex TaxID=329884 RepID=A0A4V6WLC2_9PEZI|nr:hypothetical protein B0A55_01704 [Friedmanniomyces simplex]
MASSVTYFLAAIAVLVAMLGGYIAVFGIPPQLKRQMEEKALETIGENKASYMMKDAIGKVPASDQQDVKELQKGLGNVLGGGMQNPLGKFAGNSADDATKDFTGR